MSIDRKRIEKFKKEIVKYDDLPEHLKLDDDYEKLVKDIEKYYTEVRENIEMVDNPDDYIEEIEEISKDEFVEKMDRINVLKSQIITNKKSTNKLTSLYMELYGLNMECNAYLESLEMEIENVE